MKRGLRVVDADAHVIEPMDCWSRFIDPALRDRAPRPEDIAFGMVTDGIEINTWSTREPDAPADARAHRAERLRATFAEIYPDASKRDFDAPSQLDGMDVEGVDVGFLYPSFGLFAIASDDLDPRYAAAVARAYNDWLASFCATAPDRLHGVAMVALHDPALAAVEAERAVTELGFRGVFLRPNPVGGRNFDDPAYDVLWAAIERLGVPIGIHEGGTPRLPQAGADRFQNLEQRHICSHPFEQMCAAVSFVYGGVLERFPGLRVAFLEAGCGWVPFWLERMDEHYENGLRRDYGAAKTLSMAPSDYFRRQCFVSADADESFLAQVIDVLGDGCIVFSTDYPHPDSKYPEAVDCFLRIDGVSDDSKARILWDNPARLYALEPTV